VSRSLLTGCRGGVPDHHTAARQLIKDYVDGKLRFCHMPPRDGAQGVGMCPGVNTAMLSAAAQSALATAQPQAVAGGSRLEASDAAVGAGDKDVRLGVQGAREKTVFQMDSAASAEPGVAVGQSHGGRKGRGNRNLSAGVWADADEAALLKVPSSLCVFSPFTRHLDARESACCEWRVCVCVCVCARARALQVWVNQCVLAP